MNVSKTPRHLTSSSRVQSGFTLVELVIVIIILGILAVTAAPKLSGMSSEARRAVLNTIAANIKSAADLAYVRSQLDNTAKQRTASVTLSGTIVPISYGYPTAFSGILSSVELEKVAGYGAFNQNTRSDWVYQLIINSGRQGIELSAGSVVGDGPGAPQPRTTGCFIRYLQGDENNAYELTVDDSRC